MKNSLSEHTNTERTLCDIDSLINQAFEKDRRLYDKHKDCIEVDTSINRKMVSFQANKSLPTYRWYKFKEGFSANLVEYILNRFGIMAGSMLDPFAGSGTALFVASSLGMEAEGIELLPIGQEIISIKLCLENEFTSEDYAILSKWSETHPWKQSKKKITFPVLRITKDAYPEDTHLKIEQFLGAITNEKEHVQKVLRFALLCILESISYTRKDGQYLRWDYRSKRNTKLKTPFNKGAILTFDEAISIKLNEILSDLDKQLQIIGPSARGAIRLHPGSVLTILPNIPDETYNCIFTSPPYCNRYDYTRTYALELALLGIDEVEIVKLRQAMLSCTVENKEKDLTSINPDWVNPLGIVKEEELLNNILVYLETLKKLKQLNNMGIPRMVRGYFYEMACVLYECARVLKPNGIFVMVNDNVRYAGVSISVDLILTNIAEALGLKAEKILVLPNGKGNSSQQMGEYGRDVLRKGVYVWRKRGG